MARVRATTRAVEPETVPTLSMRRAVGKASPSQGKKAQLPKEVIPGNTSEFIDLGQGGKYPGAVEVSLYVKHESTDDVLDRLGVKWSDKPGQTTRSQAVAAALEMDGHERSYIRLGQYPDLPETVGITFMSVKGAWPDAGGKPMSRNGYIPWEHADIGLAPKRVLEGAKACESRMIQFYDANGVFVGPDQDDATDADEDND